MHCCSCLGHGRHNPDAMALELGIASLFHVPFYAPLTRPPPHVHFHVHSPTSDELNVFRHPRISGSFMRCAVASTVHES